MNVKTLTRKIAEDIAMLPENKLSEVSDFVQFLRHRAEKSGVPLGETGLSVREAETLRRRLSSFEEDWEAPGMEEYDDL
ncbi:MAG: hypothetical protein KAU14_06290 [Thermoplasmata archaeon]|nr:hypothetical protein [Thermoplasmata archaeon]